MNGTIYLNFSGLLYTFLIAFCFFSKKRVKSHETKIRGGIGKKDKGKRLVTRKAELSGIDRLQKQTGGQSDVIG